MYRFLGALAMTAALATRLPSAEPPALATYFDDTARDDVLGVRTLGLGRGNFYLSGHSRGGLIAIEYALAHQEQLKGLIVSNMVSSVPGYGRSISAGSSTSSATSMRNGSNDVYTAALH